MIVWIDGNSVDRCSGNQWIIGYHVPSSGCAATVGRFPYPASDRPKISHNAAIHGGRWIDRHRINSPFGRRVIKTARAAGHTFWLRAESDKTSSAESQRTQWIQRWQALLQGPLWAGAHVERRQHATISDQSGLLDMSNDRSRIVPIAQDRQPLSRVFYRALAYTALAAPPPCC